MARKVEDRGAGASGEGGRSAGTPGSSGGRAPIMLKIIRFAALWLVVGGAITVLVAWCSATWAPPKIVGAGPLPAYPQGLTPPAPFDSKPVGAQTRQFAFDAWTVRAQRVTKEDNASREVEVWAASRWRFGLPWRSMGFEVEMAPGLPDDWRGALATGAGVGRTGSDGVRRLPVTVAPRGFAGDTVFWGALAWLVTRGPGKLRRRLRARRRLCRRCGYPVGDSPVCTECGAELGPM